MSISAAVEDPRFPQVKSTEMDNIQIEISVLSVPQKIEVETPEEYLDKIVIGRDGLIISGRGRRGLLLPQVPVEHDRNWDVLMFLNIPVKKSSYPPDAWQDLENITLENFTATIFEEEAPRGRVRQKQIGE